MAPQRASWLLQTSQTCSECAQLRISTLRYIFQRRLNQNIRLKTCIRTLSGWKVSNQRKVYFDLRVRKPEEEKRAAVDTALVAASWLAHERRQFILLHGLRELESS